MSIDLRSIRLLSTPSLVRYEDFESRPHVVVPVVALVEGVIRAINSPHPEFVPAERFSVAPSGWDGRPIFCDHPMDGPRPVSGNTPDVLRTSIGKVFHTRVSGKRLLMEAYIDIEKAKQSAKGINLLARIAAGRPIEISTGAQVTLKDLTGEHNGKTWKGQWDVIVPDHLAMLSEGSRGACSMEAGCGVRAAAEGSPLYEIDEDETLRISGGPGSGNWGHGSQGAHENAARAHRDAANEHTIAAKLSTSTSSSHAVESTKIAMKATKQTGGNGYASQAANAYAKMAGNARTAAQQKTFHEMAATHHEAAARQHELTAQTAPHGRASQEGRSMSLKEKLRDLLKALAEPDGSGDVPEELVDDTDDDTAELIAYNTLNTLLGQACDGLMDAQKTVADLIDTEAGDDADEDEKVEYARLESARVMCLSSMSTLGGIAMLIRDLQLARESDDVQKVQIVNTGMQALRASAGKRHNGTDEALIQTVHDNAVELGATCEAPMRSSHEGTPCGCGNHATKLGGENMTKDERIAALVACDCNPVKNLEALRAASEEQLVALEAYAATGVKMRAAASKSDAEKVITDLAAAHGALNTHAAGVAAAQAKKDEKNGEGDMKAAVAAAVEAALPKTEEEWLKIAPPTLRAMIDETKTANTAAKTVLVTKLKAAQSAYSEAELTAMELPQLKKLAVLAKVDVPTVDYSGFGAPRAAEEGNNYMTSAPPDGYRMALDKNAPKEKVQ